MKGPLDLSSRYLVDVISVHLVEYRRQEVKLFGREMHSINNTTGELFDQKPAYLYNVPC